MIFDWVLGPILTFLTGLFSLLPTGGLGLASGFGYGGWSPGHLAGEVAPFMQQMQYFFPMQLILLLFQIAVTVLLPALMVYELAQWGYRELPDLFGFGPS